MDEQIRREILAKTEDLIEQVFGEIEELRHGQYDQLRQRQIVSRIFRDVHSIKGATAAADLDEVSSLAHELETALDVISRGRIHLDDRVLDVLEELAFTLSESIISIAAGGTETIPETLVDRVREIYKRQTNHDSFDPESILASVPGEFRQWLSESEKERLVQAVGEGCRLFTVAARFETATFEQQFPTLRDALSTKGELISTLPKTESANPDRISFMVLYVADCDVAELKAQTASFPELSFDELHSGHQWHEIQPPIQPHANEAQPSSNFPPASSIRIEPGELDVLISSVDELFKQTTSALNLAGSAVDGNPQIDLTQVEQEVRRSFISLEEQIIALRRVSLGRVLQRAARAGRAAARVGDKEIDFQVLGSEVRVDKLISEAIADPLIHLVRNAVDHGIESPHERVKSEKKARGSVGIKALQEGNRTRIRVTDDGRGINPQLISEAAEELGIIQKGITLDMEQSLRLIFRPGFSTASSVSTVSGRGIGLEVVETAVEQVGGELRLRSEPGKGASFEIRLPQTFGLLNSVVVSSDDNRYCLDAASVIATEVVDAAAIEDLEDNARVVWKGVTLSLVHLRKLLSQPPDGSNARDHLNVLVYEIRNDEAGRGPTRPKRLAIAVDGVEGTQQVLVRSLGRNAARWREVAGAAELQDGSVALVLDLPRLLEIQ